MIASKPGESIEFLKRWGPPPWHLTAIAVDRKGIETQSFEDLETVYAWLTERIGRDNIYFHVNPTLGTLTTKASREDIKSLSWLHVDVDPKKGQDLSKEQDRALKMFERPPAGVPKPTCVVFSGGGYQGFWRLQDPFVIDGDLERAEQAKLYNLQLETLFGADNCHNVDRIMRLPGTINIPDKKKIAKGRTTALARVVWFDDVAYPLSDFNAAPVVQVPGGGFSGSSKIEISGNIERLGSIDDLDTDTKQLPDYAKILIVQGNIPDDPTKYESRSEALFAACCALVRHGCTDEQIYSIITDPDFGISASVLDKKSSAERYALRQIERAREDAINPALRRMNEKHAVIGNLNGRCRVIEEVYDHAMKRTRIVKQSFEDIRNRYMNQKVVVGNDKDGNPITGPLGKWWLQHENRRQFETVVFSPEGDVDGAFNLWRGFACEARPGNVSPFLQHVKNIICQGEDLLFSYVIGWLARCVQQPASPGESAIVLRGRQGTGKSAFAKIFGSLWGRHFLQVSDPKHLVGSFNSHLRDCVVLFGDEAFFAGDKKHESVLKTLITEETIVIEPKGVDAEAAPNYLHVILASNSNWVVPANLDERRFLVLDVNDEFMQNTDYFTRLFHWANNGGKEALLHYLMGFDISDFNLRQIPQTKALLDQKLYTLGTEQEWWYKKLQDGRLIDSHETWKCNISKNILLDDYLTYCQRIGVTRRATATILGKFLSSVCKEGWPRTHQTRCSEDKLQPDGSIKVIHTRPYFYQFPDLDACRDHWDNNFGGPYEWTDIETKEPF